MEDLDKEMELIYNSLCDNESRVIFRNMMEYYRTGNIRHIFNRAYSYEELASDFNEYRINTIDDYIYNYQSYKKYVIIYGTGLTAKHTYEMLQRLSIKVKCFCKGESEKNIEVESFGIPIISSRDLVRYSDEVVILIATDYKAFRDIYYLVRQGIQYDQMRIQHKTLEAYFSPSFIQPSSNEIFIDAGGYDGDSLVKFMEWCGGKYKKIYSFEPDHENFCLLEEKVKNLKLDNTKLVEKGLWSSNTQLSFYSMADMGSMICKTGNSVIPVTTLDECIADDTVTFIKMDVEGAEMEALKGARNSIVSNIPKLAISIYHKPEDIVEIPLYIKQLCPEYKFYIRQHTWELTDTVLYAI